MNSLSLPPEVRGTPEEDMGLERLPASVEEAIAAFEKDSGGTPSKIVL